MSAFEASQAGDLVQQARQYFSHANPDDAGPNVGHSERLVSSLAGACLLAAGLSSSRKGSLLMAGLGGALLYRGMSGTCHTYKALGINTHRRSPATVIPAQQGCRVEKTVIVNRPPAELYGFWREVENLPKVMQHLKSVEVIDRERSHWTADAPLGKELQWDAEIFNDAENELIAWRSLPGGDVDTVGSVRFQPIGQHFGTAVTVNMKYDPPAGKVGSWIAALMGSSPEKMLEGDLQRFKQMMEAEQSLSTGEPMQQSGAAPPM
jgi:uncharacterized membrane protein